MSRISCAHHHDVRPGLPRRLSLPPVKPLPVAAGASQDEAAA
ncbi:hypothetical protein [Azospirillum sp. sgz301742]